MWFWLLQGTPISSWDMKLLTCSHFNSSWLSLFMCAFFNSWYFTWDRHRGHYYHGSSMKLFSKTDINFATFQSSDNKFLRAKLHILLVAHQINPWLPSLFMISVLWFILHISVISPFNGLVCKPKSLASFSNFRHPEILVLPLSGPSLYISNTVAEWQWYISNFQCQNFFICI